MKKRINFDLLKKNQLKAQKIQNPFQQMLYKHSYQLVNDLLCDIKKPFKNICIHGYYPKMMMHHLKDYLITQNYISDPAKQLQKKQSQNQANNVNTELTKITLVDYLNLDPFQEKYQFKNIFETHIVNVQNSDQFLPEEDQFDLIISGLELNHTNNEQVLLEKYLRTLKPDGALIGCAMVQGTLSQLNWSYLMAQNQRYGGVSPKILNLPSLGQLGNMLTTTHYHLVTVLNRDLHLEFESPLDLIKAIQIIGENNHLKGRRKAVYKDLLLSMYALYQSEFSLQNMEDKRQNILSTLILSPFVGWKYSPNQPKPLRRGQHGDSIDFVDDLRKYDPDLQHFRINEDTQEVQQVKSNKNNNQQQK